MPRGGGGGREYWLLPRPGVAPPSLQCHPGAGGGRGRARVPQRQGGRPAKLLRQLARPGPPHLVGFDLSARYVGAGGVDGAALVAPFSRSEVREAVFALDRTSAPGPDGLGPAFYQAAWAVVADDLIALFDAVHARTVRLGGINRALIALLPKQEGVPGPGDFRPVSLQNGDVKILCRGLTTRLQRQIGPLIDEDQSGFLSGRSISENFVYAAELVQCCKKRGASTLVFKLDFAKAFDSIAWPSLRLVMEARGFPPAWCDWMDLMFRLSRSAVLLNGVPGRWFEVKLSFGPSSFH